MSGKLSELRAWAAGEGVRVTVPEDFPTGDFRTDPRIDFGRYIRRNPGLMLHPSDVDQLCACMRKLGTLEVPFTTRAAGHSSGGQILIEGGVVLDLRALNRIVSDDPEMQTVTVEGGARWLDVIEYLAPMGRRPPVLTDNSRSSVGGTLAVGGFGSSSHRNGMQVQQVRALTVVTLDGERHSVRQGDDLYAYTLCGRGQLGVIADATLATVARSSVLRGRMLGWRSIVNFMESAQRVLENGYYDFFRAMMLWAPDLPVMAVSGDLGETLTPVEQVRPEDATPLEALDLLESAREDHIDKWQFVTPALELLLPLPEGLHAFRRIIDRIIEEGLHVYMPRGSSLMVLKRPQGLPLAPFPPTELALLVALRCELPTAEEASKVLPALRDIGSEAMKAGARCYLISLELEMADFLERQFGDALPEFKALKDRYDPKRLLNPWLL